jgi:hypothetical protein
MPDITARSGAGRRLLYMLVTGGIWMSLGALAPTLAAAKPPTCVGSPTSPGVLSGTYSSGVIVEGRCLVNAGPVVVRGNLTIREGGALGAIFAFNDVTQSGKSNLTVYGNVRIQQGGSLYMGCEPNFFTCKDDESNTAASRDRVFGNIVAEQPRAVIIHASLIAGSISETGGGGGDAAATCESEPPVYSDYEDLTVHGNLTVTGLESCWLGLARDRVSGNVRLVRDLLADPDAIEVLSNTIAGNLSCQENSRLWNSSEQEFESLFPRESQPNKVNGNRSGQCVNSSPETQEALEKGEFGSGPF